MILLLATGAAANAVTISEVTEQITPNSYSNWFPGLFTSDGESRAFTTTPSVRGPDHQHDLARDFIASNFQAMGYDVWLDPFTYDWSGWSGQESYHYTNCNNVVAVKPGQGGTNVYIVGAHYDTVDEDNSGTPIVCPGADDNASGVAGILEAARVLQDFTFRDTIIFIAFDAEETGAFGSLNFVNTHTTTDLLSTNATTFYRPAIKAMISADMIAYDDGTNPNNVSIYSADSNTNTPVHQALGQAITRYTALNPVHLPNVSDSDHEYFHAVGIDAVVFSENDIDINPNWHDAPDSTDTPNYMNYAYGAENAKALTGYLSEQAQVILPVTLYPPVVNGNLFTLSWDTTAGVSYAAYSTMDLTDTNGWQLIVQFGPSASNSTISVQVNTDGKQTQAFKVESF